VNSNVLCGSVPPEYKFHVPLFRSFAFILTKFKFWDFLNVIEYSNIKIYFINFQWIKRFYFVIFILLIVDYLLSNYFWVNNVLIKCDEVVKSWVWILCYFLFKNIIYKKKILFFAELYFKPAPLNKAPNW
jgi:hypothetical protein